MNDTAGSSHHRRELVREGVTMALYLSLSLLAVLLAMPTAAEADPADVIFLTAVGLLVAHLLAFAVSSRLVSRGLFDAQSRQAALAQIAGGSIVVALATLPVLVLEMPNGLRVAEGALMLLVAWVGYLAARQADVSVLRSCGYVAVVLVATGLVLALKALVGH